MADQYKRNIAHKISVGLIINSGFVKKEGWDPSVIVTPHGHEIARVNVFGVITQHTTDEQGRSSLVLTDHTGSISLRSFDNDIIFKDINVGESVSVIGKPRQFNNETYLNAEIVKKITDPNWLALRKIELELLETGIDYKAKPSLSTEPKQEMTTEEVKDEANEGDLLIELIAKLDSGEGADIQEVMQKSKTPEAENLITALLEAGEIYEIKKGRIKVL